MRPKYPSRCIVLARYPAGEANVSLILLTPEFGLVRARAQGLRKEGAKLAPALQTLAECEAVLVRGKDGWRLSGAVLSENWARALSSASRERAGRIAALIMRLVRGESADPTIFFLFTDFLTALMRLPEEHQEMGEVVTALALLNTLGLDDQEIPADALAFKEEALASLASSRRDLVLRVNRGLTASGL